MRTGILVALVLLGSAQSDWALNNAASTPKMTEKEAVGPVAGILAFVGATADQIGVHVYNDARVPEDKVRAAEEDATRVLRLAGIEVKWTDCTVVRGAQRAESSSCALPLRSTDLLAHFVDRREAHFSLVDRDALGYSIIPDTGELATIAYVSYPRIQELSTTTSLATEDLLGLAVAHEIGHLLLGSRQHANQGLMRAQWSLRGLEAKTWDEFQFTEEEAKRLRVAVESRHRETPGSLVSASSISYAVIGATPTQESALRVQIQIMHPDVLPLRIFFVPHWKYLDTARLFHLHVPAGYGSVMFTHLPSRTVFIDNGRYQSEEWLGYWMAHELGHMKTNSVPECDAERAAHEFRKRLRRSQSSRLPNRRAGSTGPENPLPVIGVEGALQ